MIVRDTVGLVVLAHNEGGALQGTGTDHTGEALWVVGFASGPQHAVSDRLPTGVALLQGLLGKNRAGCEGTRVSKAHPARSPSPDLRYSSSRNRAPLPDCRTALPAAAAGTDGK